MLKVGKRWILISCGLLATSLAIVGVWLPGLPTTPFVLLALWAFGLSSERLYQLLSKLPVLKNALAEAERYQRQRIISQRTKTIAQVSAWGSVGLVILSGELMLVLMVAMAAVACSLFMYKTKSSG